MLFLGAVALYIGATRRFFRGHKIFGYAYLVGGTVAALVALVLNFSNVHNNPSISAATGTLAAAWIAVAGMAYRAARNRRFEVHREWMVRSYVLTWTFVFCRLVQSSSAMSQADVAGVATAIWMTWVIPLLVCELALQWPRTSATT